MLDSLTILSQAVAFKDYTNISLQQLYDEQYIKQGNILFYNRTYKDVEFTHKCKIKNIYNIRKLSVIFTFANNKEMLMSFDSLTELELYILKSNDRFKNIKRASGNAYDWFFIIDKDVNKGSITELRKQHVKNKINPTEKLGERDILPVRDSIRFKLLNKAKNEFLKRYDKKIPFSCVIEGLVDDKEVLVAFVDQSEGTLVHLPAEFESFPVLISYEALELYHRSYHKDLIPGISIVSNKTFILTAKHGVGKEDEKVVQPGTLDEVNASDREIPKLPNVPFKQHIQIRSIKTSVNNNDDFVNVKKVGEPLSSEKAESGDSGSPVFDNDGKLWGIVIAGISRTEGKRTGGKRTGGILNGRSQKTQCFYFNFNRFLYSFCKFFTIVYFQNKNSHTANSYSCFVQVDQRK
ncbi:7978_t:CDS:2 [Funneliformis mosseae]|uniref:7978_t:CDS:1 n=1 Tax=Funneliformis mosseae TaxID=27381 RepID=A0A9N9F621_FUNMO|nr:7978_t:CDS:2 [Funneliformis mosseae]